MARLLAFGCNVTVVIAALAGTLGSQKRYEHWSATGRDAKTWAGRSKEVIVESLSGLEPPQGQLAAPRAGR
jgi:hypothetical protein